MSDYPNIMPMLAGAEARFNLAHPKNVEATCYYCGQPFLVRDCERADPPDYRIIARLDQIKPIATCGATECLWKDTQRQDAIFCYLQQLAKSAGAGLPAAHGETRS